MILIDVQNRPRRRAILTPVFFFIVLQFASGLHAQPARSLELSLPTSTRGQAAVHALGARLPDVANAYGLSPERLAALLERQPSLAVDRSGALLFWCDGLAIPADAPPAAFNEATTTDTGSAITATAASTADPFQLHSFPGASRVIYLDFNGHTTAGTGWNSVFAGGAPIVSQPFDLDGNPAAFNATELTFIRNVWKRVAEDYAPFAIDVTTEDPGVEALRRSSTADTAFGMRIVISPTNWYKSTAGGVAYLGSFAWGTDTPCFVFTGQLANSEKPVAEAAAHECGHTLGLYHDGAGGSSPTEYYHGHGNWAPIMGVSYYKAITQWSRGEYAAASNLEDDLAIMAANGAILPADDHGSTLATATALAGPDVADGGTIEHRLDADLFRFTTGAGAISLSIGSPAPQPNLDIKAELLDAGGQLLLASNPTTLGASLATTVAAGTYHLRISGVGAGDPLTTGYSTYGSLGNYVITGGLVATSSQLAPAAVASATPLSGTVPLAVSFNGQASTDTDGTIVSHHWSLGNGTTSTQANPSVTYTAAGSYIALLTVIDNDGLASTATVAITVHPATNAAPAAVVSAAPTSGTVPLPVSFSGAGSSDPDGTITGYFWDFGDGSTSTAAAVTKTYTTAGTYTAKLTVTDNQGAVHTTAVAINATAAPVSASTQVDVHQFTLTTAKKPNGTTGTAVVVVRDAAGNPVPNVSLTVNWTGALSHNNYGKTDVNGQFVAVSPHTRRTGSLSAKITALKPPAAFIYNQTLYAEPIYRVTTID